MRIPVRCTFLLNLKLKNNKMKKLPIQLLLLVLFAQSALSQKAEVKDVIAKHIASVSNSPAKLKNLTALGEAGYIQGSNHQRPWVGKGVIVSEGKNLAIAMTFPLDNYPVERINSDGKKLVVQFVRPGTRSALGEYLVRNEEIIKEGIFGGTLSTAWLLNYPDEKKGSMSMQGTKKVNDREAYIISYSTRAGTGLSVRFFFDVETGRHLRTEYRRVISAQMGPTPELSARQNETIEEFTEDFGDFKTEGGFTLPRSYKLQLARVTGGNRREFFYDVALSSFYYNQQLDPATFEMESK